MKKLILIISVLFIFQNYANSVCNNYELCIKNNTSHTIRIQIYPVSVIFSNRGNLNFVTGFGYPNFPVDPNGRVFNYINGMFLINEPKDGEFYVTKKHYFDIQPQQIEGLEVDKFVNPLQNLSAVGAFGYGTYKIEIIHLNQNYDRDSLLADFDYYCVNGFWFYECPQPPYPTQEPPGDLAIEVNGVNNLTYLYDMEGNIPVTVNYNNGPHYYTARSWYPNGPNNSNNSRAKRMGPTLYGPETFFHPFEPENLIYYNIFNYFPLDVRIDCGGVLNSPTPGIANALKDQNHIFPISHINGWEQIYTGRKEVRQGTLKCNLLITSDIQTHSTNEGASPWTVPLIIDAGATLKLYNSQIQGMIYTLNKNNFTYDEDFYLRILSNGTLNINTGSQILAKEKTHVVLEANSNLIVNNRLNPPQPAPNNKPHIKILDGASFCNHTDNIEGRLWIQFSRKPSNICDVQNDGFMFKDSMRVQLSDSAMFEIPDNTTLLIDGPETNLILDSNSTIKFGNNAKLVVKNGANINAIKSKFTSLTSGSVWDGIYLEDVSNDVIKNCVIENAMSGINVKNKSNEMGGDTILASVEISDCQFINSTTTQLVNGIYLTNSNCALIRNNTFSSSLLSNGFINAIAMEYCSSGNIDIIDNTLNYSLIGISAIHSTPYIARNSITGQQNSNYGIFLDNSSGTIKNNAVSNFKNSMRTYYSSPYLLKNNFTNATDNVLEFYSNSSPIMKPVSSGSLLYWYSGNNNIAGTPTYAGININDGSGPELDAGYNIIAVNGSSYIKGSIPSYMDGILYATYNNWQDEIPDEDYFNVEDGIVEYEPTFDGVTTPDYDTYDLNSIGFGLFDTVFVKDLGDSPNAETVFLQAYKKEVQKQYNEAINLYKNVIRDNKKSVYALSSIPRILNCYEKGNSNHGHYIALQNYLTQIKNNNTYPDALKDIAEDFIIKTKVKLGQINSAIQDYTLMYQQNQNTPKGFHALINKEYVTTLLLGDNNNKYDNSITHKLNLMALLMGDNAKTTNLKKGVNIPGDYTLFNNYPNPFNPSTTIKFGLPKKAHVDIKVFDITGREIVTLINESKDAGYHTILFNGYGFASGIYFYKMEIAGKVLVGKMMLIK